jgi:hypothetical protein
MQMSAVPYIACILGADSKTHALAPNPFNSALGPRAFDPVVNAYDNDVCNQSMSFVFSSTFAVVQILVAIHSSSSSNEIVSVGSNLHKKKKLERKKCVWYLVLCGHKKNLSKQHKLERACVLGEDEEKFKCLLVVLAASGKIHLTAPLCCSLQRQ